MTSLARLERAALCQTARTVGPDAPTLCAGWTVRDLLLHLIVRERRPWASVGNYVSALGGLTDRATASLRGRSFDELLELCAEPPALLRIERLDAAVNGVEFFIHHEDIRRARAGWTPRELPVDARADLWRGLSFLGRMAARRAGVPVVVTDGTRRMTLRKGRSPVEVTAPVSELILAAAGRRQLADLDWVATPQQREAVKAANLSL